jgi:hypothetical protein
VHRNASHWRSPSAAAIAIRKSCHSIIIPIALAAKGSPAMRASIPVNERAFRVRGFGLWPLHTRWWMVAGFVIALVLTAIIFAILGVGERGTGLALRVTARWSFLLFWFAYAGGAVAKLCGPLYGDLARRGRELGLAFASAQLVHVGLVLWIIHIATKPVGAMVFFWAGILCTYLLALFSLGRLRDALGPRLWRGFLTVALEYIAIVFAADFILNPLHAAGLRKYPLSYLPFALILVAGAGLRIAAFLDHKSRQRSENALFGARSSSIIAQFGGASRDAYTIEQTIQADATLPDVDRGQSKVRTHDWPLEVFVGALLITLALGHALRTFLGAGAVLYGPATVMVGACFFSKFAVHRAKSIW